MSVDARQSEPQSWFVALILYGSSAEAAPTYTPLYEECFVLFRARSLEEAREKAERHAAQAETSYENVYGEQLHWRRKQVVDVAPSLDDSLEDGTELYARHFRDLAAYRAFECLLEPGPDSDHADGSCSD